MSLTALSTRQLKTSLNQMMNAAHALNQVGSHAQAKAIIARAELYLAEIKRRNAPALAIAEATQPIAGALDKINGLIGRGKAMALLGISAAVLFMIMKK